MNSKYIPLILFILVFIIYFLSSFGHETPYNYFSRLALSFTEGHLFLKDNPPWLNELIPLNGKYYVVYPPMPALIIVPLTLLLGLIPQTLFSIFLGAVNAVLVFLLLQKKFSFKTSILVTMLFAFGTNHWYLASIGSAWFLAHIVALFFLLLSLLELFGKQRLFLIGLFLGASFWSRTTVIFTAPFFYIYLYSRFLPLNKKSLLNFILITFGPILFIILDGLYNYFRFGNFSALSPYQLIPNISKDPIFQQGFMSLSYIPRHLEAMFWKLPVFKNTPPFIIPSLYSMAIWITSPTLVFTLKAKKSLLTISLWIGIIRCFFIISLWGGVGFAQFGYRFAQDFMPLLLILTALGIGEKPSKLAYILVTLSVLVNLWGVVMINYLNLFSW